MKEKLKTIAMAIAFETTIIAIMLYSVWIYQKGEKNGRKNAQMLHMAHNNFSKNEIFKKGV